MEGDPRWGKWTITPRVHPPLVGLSLEDKYHNLVPVLFSSATMAAMPLLRFREHPQSLAYPGVFYGTRYPLRLQPLMELMIIIPPLYTLST